MRIGGLADASRTLLPLDEAVASAVEVRRQAGWAAMVLVLLSALTACTSGGTGNPATDDSIAPTPPGRPDFPKTLPVKIDGKRFSAYQVTVKWREGTDVEVAGDGWVARGGGSPTDDRAANQSQADITPQAVQQSLRDANAVVAAISGARLIPMVSASVDAELDTFAARARAADGGELADLGLYSYVVLPRPDPAAAQHLIDQLADLEAIEQVYAQPIPQDADDIPPTTTIDLRPSQGYLRAAPAGIDLPFAHRFRLSRGEGVSVVDVEAGWQLDHEDLPGPGAVFSWHGINLGGDHGTAVAGEIWGRENQFGVDGIAPASRMGWSSVAGAQFFPNPIYSPAAAIANAAADLVAGDVILIEQHVPEWFVGVAFPPDQCNQEQLGYLPVEIYGAEFDAISAATAKGIVVVEAAGNGSMDLDGYPEFDRTARDSGAIVVGASAGGGSTTPACWTNNGNRVDVFAWGGGVSTLGYGQPPALQANGSDPRQWYTRSFSGTSSASPIVAGTVAVLQGILAGQGMPKLNSTEMRALLSSTGTPQTPGKAIGTQPDLRAALRSILPDTGQMTINAVPRQARPGQPIVGSIRVSNTGPVRWTVADHRLSCAWQGLGTPVTVAPIPDGMEIGDVASASLTTTAPSVTGEAVMRCDLTAGALVASDVAATIVAPAGGVFDAQVLDITLPATMPYGRQGDLAEPRDGTITVRNTGTQAWNLATFPDLGVLTRPVPGVPNTVPLPQSVAPGSQIVVTASFECIRAGTLTVTAQVGLGIVGFGSTQSAQTRCVGTN